MLVELSDPAPIIDRIRTTLVRRGAMAVLTEALSMIVRESTLGESYPGGSEAFIAAMSAGECPARSVCSDGELVSASFHSAEDATAIAGRLEALGLVVVSDNVYVDIAFVDPRRGLCMHCEWLEWRLDAEGYSYAWLAGTDCGELAAPPDWTQAKSRALAFRDVRDEPGRCLRLASEDGVESWLDFDTGRILVGLSQRDGDTPVQKTKEDFPKDHAPSTNGSLVNVVRGYLDEMEYKYLVVDAERTALKITETHGTYEVRITVDEQSRRVICHSLFGPRMPENRLVEILEAVARANDGLIIGNFELNFETSALCFKASFDADGVAFFPAMMHNMLVASMCVCEGYHDALMSVAFGGAKPAIAIAAVENG